MLGRHPVYRLHVEYCRKGDCTQWIASRRAIYSIPEARRLGVFRIVPRKERKKRCSQAGVSHQEDGQDRKDGAHRGSDCVHPRLRYHYGMKRTAIILAAIAIILIGIFAFGNKATAPTLPDPISVATTTATSTDSGAVPATTTSEIPSGQGSATSKTATLKLGETQTVNGLSVKAWAVLEDSRCPTDVQCVWAGMVRIALHVSGTGAAAGQSASVELEPGQSKSALGKQVALDAVTPHPISTKKIQDDEYRLSVTVR